MEPAGGPTEHDTRGATNAQHTASQDIEVATTFDKVRSALRNMGFRDRLARAAIAKVVEMHDANELFDFERVLRDALAVATAA